MGTLTPLAATWKDNVFLVLLHNSFKSHHMGYRFFWLHASIFVIITPCVLMKHASARSRCHLNVTSANLLVRWIWKDFCFSTITITQLQCGFDDDRHVRRTPPDNSSHVSRRKEEETIAEKEKETNCWEGFHLKPRNEEACAVGHFGFHLADDIRSSADIPHENWQVKAARSRELSS